MHNASDHIETEERNASFRTSAGVPLSWSLTATVRHQSGANIKAVLPAIAGHDLHQPLQVIHGAHEHPGLGIRMSSELQHLQNSNWASKPQGNSIRTL